MRCGPPAWRAAAYSDAFDRATREQVLLECESLTGSCQALVIVLCRIATTGCAICAVLVATDRVDHEIEGSPVEGIVDESVAETP